MRILPVGAGGVGSAVTTIAARRDFVTRLAVADFDPAHAEKAVAAAGDPRFVAARVDASDEAGVRALLAEHGCDVLLNATDPRFVMPLFRASLAAGVDYLDTAMSLSRPHPERPYELTGVKLGDEQLGLPRLQLTRRVGGQAADAARVSVSYSTGVSRPRRRCRRRR